MRIVSAIGLVILVCIGWENVQGQAWSKDFSDEYVMTRCVQKIIGNMPDFEFKRSEMGSPSTTSIGQAIFENNEVFLRFWLRVEKNEEEAKRMAGPAYSQVGRGPIKLFDLGEEGGFRYGDDWLTINLVFRRGRLVAQVLALPKDWLLGKKLDEETRDRLLRELVVCTRSMACLIDQELLDLRDSGSDTASPSPEVHHQAASFSSNQCLTCEKRLSALIEELQQRTPGQPFTLREERTCELIRQLAESKYPQVVVPLIRSFSVQLYGRPLPYLFQAIHQAVALGKPKLRPRERDAEESEINRQISKLRNHHDIIPTLKRLCGIKELDEKTEAHLIEYFYEAFPAVGPVKQHFGESAIPALLREALNSDQTWYRERIALAVRAILSREKIAALKKQYAGEIAEVPSVGEFFDMLTREDFSVDVTFTIGAPTNP